LKKAKKSDCKKGAPNWMVTYGDMITLMLTFFVALLAFSSISPGKFQEVASGLARIFSGNPPSVLMGGRSTVTEPIITSNPGIQEDLLKIQQDETFKGKITVQQTDQGTLITLGNMEFFEPDSARLTVDAKNLLEKLGSIIVEHTTNAIDIHGFTDDRNPSAQSVYPSNWHLSSARASSVARYFSEDLKNKRIAERIVDIRSGKFDPDTYYDPSRFAPIGKADVAINREISQLDARYRSEIELLDYKLRDGEITEAQRESELRALKDTYSNELSALRAGYQKIEILIKREKAR